MDGGVGSKQWPLPSLRIPTVDPSTIQGELDPWTQVRAVLASAKSEGLPFDGPEGVFSQEGAWFWAMRAISAPRTASPAVIAEIEDSRKMIHEAKTFFRAAYENREMTGAELDLAFSLAEKRLDQAFADAPAQIAA